MDARFRIFIVKVIAFIGDEGRWAQHQVTVGKAARHKELAVGLSIEPDAVPFPEGRLLLPEVDHHIDDLSVKNADQLGLFERPQLVVESPEHPGSGVNLDILYEHGMDAGFLELALVKAFEEKAPLVPEDPGLENLEVPEGSIEKRHDSNVCIEGRR